MKYAEFFFELQARLRQEIDWRAVETALAPVAKRQPPRGQECPKSGKTKQRQKCQYVG